MLAQQPKALVPVSMPRGDHAAVARAVVDSVAEGVIPKDKAEEYVIVCGVFIAGSANDNKKIYKNNYEAVKLAIKNAMKGTPTIDDIIADLDEINAEFEQK